MDECVIYIAPCDLSRIINEALCVFINGNGWIRKLIRFQVLAFKTSLEATLGGGMAPTNDERVTILVA